MKTLGFHAAGTAQIAGDPVVTEFVRAWRSRLRRILPRTMTGLVAGGCLLAAAPLLIALVLAGSQLDRLTRHSELLIKEGFAVVHFGEKLRDDVGDLDRAIRQYAVLQDPALAELVKNRIGQIQASLLSLENQNLPPLAEPVSTAKHEVARIAALWADARQQSDSLDGMVLGVLELGGEADEILSSGGRAIDVQVQKLHQASAAARRVMLISSMAVIPLTALLALSFSVAVMRPLKRMGRGITELGHGDYRHPISIEFPSEMRQLGQRLDWLRLRLAQLEADKDRFLRHVSHELKTPLASLQEGVALMDDESLGPLTEYQKEVTCILGESTSELDGLIHNLLAYAEWRNQREQSASAWFDARPLAKAVLAKHKLSLDRRRIAVELWIDCEHLYGHRLQMHCALENLLTNAIKHAPQETSIEVRMSVRRGHCEVSVRDHGRGVVDREKRLIFEPFVRGSEAEEAGIRGTGVGLSIVQETVLAHHGSVEVEDAKPGALFRMVWPCPPARA